MTNYENQKKEIDLILNDACGIAVNKDTNKVVKCNSITCDKCLFSHPNDGCANCNINAMKWLVTEYVEPQIDWSKVPIDTPVLAAMNKSKWYNFYFAGTDDRGNTYVYSYGRTSWSSKTADNGDTVKVPYIKLAEVE